MNSLVPRGARTLSAGLFRHSVAVFLASLVLVFMAAPFLEEFPDGYYLEAVLLSLVLVSAVLAVGARRRTLVAALVLAVPMLAGLIFFHRRTEGVAYRLFMAEFLLFTILVVLYLLRFILRAPRVNSEVLCAGVATYLLFGLLWAAAYALAARLVPDAFAGLPPDRQPLKGFTALYFSIITLTTVGYGDIVPSSGATRMMVMMEALTGTLYMAVLVARLVSLYSTAQIVEPDRQNPNCDDPP